MIDRHLDADNGLDIRPFYDEGVQRALHEVLGRCPSPERFLEEARFFCAVVADELLERQLLASKQSASYGAFLQGFIDSQLNRRSWEVA